MRVLVLGAGVSGVAAAFAAQRTGAEVTVVHSGAGAASLYSGALDDGAMARDVPVADADTELLRFAAAFETWSVGPGACVVATEAGVAREARGRDVGLLDLAPLGGKRIAVADTFASGWDPHGLARSLAASPWALRTGTRFEPVPVRIVEETDVSRWPPYDVAALLDAPERARGLGRRLREASPSCDAWLLGPWLGTTPDGVGVVSEALGMPCGEVTSAPGAVAGARFEAARARLFAELGLTEVRERVEELGTSAGGWSIRCRSGRRVDAEAVVVALGGVVSGGVVLVDPDRTGRGHFDLGIRAPLCLGLDGRRVDAASTLHGVDLQAVGLGALERVGVMTDGSRAMGAAPGLFVAGDIVADAPHTALAAARAGLAAGARAARV